MTHKVKCPGEGKETFLCHHARTGLRSRSIVGAMPCARPVTGPIRLALSFANKVLEVSIILQSDFPSHIDLPRHSRRDKGSAIFL